MSTERYSHHRQHVASVHGLLYAHGTNMGAVRILVAAASCVHIVRASTRHQCVQPNDMCQHDEAGKYINMSSMCPAAWLVSSAISKDLQTRRYALTDGRTGRMGIQDVN